jgi:hypothetical protein
MAGNMTSVTGWKYRRKISNVSKLYRGGEPDAENFERFEVYRFLMLRNPER